LHPRLKRLAQQAFSRLGYRVEGIRYTPAQYLDQTVARTLTFDDVICRRMYETGPELSFLQVGAYDGVSTDPLRKYIERCGWRGVMLEPQPGPAARLRALYAGNPGITVVEAALDHERGERSLFTVEGDGLPAWAGGMASFDRGHIVRHRHLIPGVEERIRELRVKCVVFEDVLGRFPEGRLDVLQIDAEGADGEILALFPFERLKPVVVHWEIKNMDRAGQERALGRLIDHGYRVCRSGGEDAMAVLDRSPAEARD
jgi:FkbM family methyltransferase